LLFGHNVAVVLTPPEPPPVDNMMRNEIISFLLRLGAATALSYFTIKMMMKYIDPTSDDKEKAEKLVGARTCSIRMLGHRHGEHWPPSALQMPTNYNCPNMSS
jgi:hypothetical protein